MGIITKVFLYVVLYLLVVNHALLVFLNLGAFCVLPFKADWFFAAPLCTFLGLLLFSKSFQCPLTALENNLRNKLSLKPIKTFVGHYFFKPIYITVSFLSR